MPGNLSTMDEVEMHLNEHNPNAPDDHGNLDPQMFDSQLMKSPRKVPVQFYYSLYKEISKDHRNKYTKVYNLILHN